MEHAERIATHFAKVPDRWPDQGSWFDSILSVLRARPAGRARNVPKNIPTFAPVSRFDYNLGYGMVRPDVTTYWCTVYDDYPDEQVTQHDWWRIVTTNKQVHPAVRQLVDDGWCPAGGTENLALEFPRSSDDGTRLSYIPSESKGADWRWTETSPGKYIKARWPYLRDDYIRDLVAAHTLKPPEILHTADDFIVAAQEGPPSCMSWDGWSGEFSEHPYYVYAPKFGWRIAVRRGSGGTIDSRTMLLHPSRGPYVEGEPLAGSVFVRSYRRGNDGYSCSDNEVEAWLTNCGCEKVSGWPKGTKLRRVEHPCDSDYDFMVPYIDGANHCIEDRHSYLEIVYDGPYEARNTDGGYECGADRQECEHCGRDVDPEDGILVGYDRDTFVGACCSDAYAYVRGRRGWEYYVPNDEAVETTDGAWYDVNYLDGNGIVKLHNGDYCRGDDAFCCPINGQWYVTEDGVYVEDLQETVHGDDAWQCAATNNWYSPRVKPVEFDGGMYHPDDAPEGAELSYDKPDGSISNEAQTPLDLPEPVVAPNADVATLTFKVYRHPAAPRTLYRAGRNGRIDVYRLREPHLNRWEYGVGEPNEWLTDGLRRYEEVPLHQRRFKCDVADSLTYRVDPSGVVYCNGFRSGSTADEVFNGGLHHEIEPDLTFQLTRELETA